MYSMRSGDVSYIIPMDDVDMKYLRRCEQLGDSVKPLWSARQKEYAEFQLKAWRRTSNDEEQNDTINTTMCYICDTRVPIIYIKEHNNSKKHKIFLKIIDEALSRLRSNINIDIPVVSPIEPSKSSYFCEPCSISVLTNYKDIHEASTIHKESKKHDEILENFVMVLKKDSATNPNNAVDTSKGGNINCSVTNPNNAVDTSKGGNVNCSATNSNNAVDTSKDRNIICSATNSNIAVDTSKDGNINCSAKNSNNAVDTSKNGNINCSATNSNNAVDTSKAGNIICSAKNSNNAVDTSKDGNINCSATNATNPVDSSKAGNINCSAKNSNNAVDTSKDRNNSSATNSNNATDTSIDGINNSVPKKQHSELLKPLEMVKEYIKVITHKMTTDSMKIEVLTENYIVIKLIKKSFRVHIDHFHGFVTVNQGVQCSLCNVLVNSKNDHMWTGQHMRWLIYNLADEQCIRKINQYYCHCIICNEFIRSVDKHKALDSNHTNKLKNALYNAKCQQTQPSIRNSETAADTQLENKNIENNHSKSNEHIQQTKNTETKYVHYLILPIDFNDADVICMLCNRVIPNTKINIEGHLNGKSHKKVYNDLLSTNRINKVQNGFTCDFCRELLPDETEVDHALSEDHEMYKSGSIQFTTDQTYCEPCMIYIDTHNLKDHRNGRKHKQKSSQQTTNNAKSDSLNVNKTNATATTNQETSLNKSVVTKGVSPSVSTKFENIPLSSVIDTKSSVSKSKICQPNNQAIQPSTSNIKVNSPITELKLPNTQTQFALKNIQPKTSVQPVTNINQPSTSGIQKAEANSEIKNLQTLMSTLNTKSSISENKTSDAINIQPSLKTKIHYQMKETENPNRLLCKVCNVPVPNKLDNITTHTNGYNHKTNYTNLLLINNVVEVESNFHCKKCNVHVTNKNEIDHIFGNKHKKAFSDDQHSVSSLSEISDHHSDISEKLSRTEKNIEYDAKLYLFHRDLITQELYCKVCHVKVCNTVAAVIDHTYGANHVTKYNDILKQYSIVKTKNGFHCSICNENISNQNEFLHILSTNHQLRLLGTKDDDDLLSTNHQLRLFRTQGDDALEIHCSFCDIYVPSNDYLKHKISISHDKRVQNISKGALMVYFYKTTGKSYIKCKLCDCTVANVYKRVIEHIKGSTHMTAYDKLLDVNKICLLGNEMYYCPACKEFITTNDELVHIWKSYHSRNMELM